MSACEGCGQDHSKDLSAEEVAEIGSFLLEQFTKFPQEILMVALQAAVTEVFIRCRDDKQFAEAWGAFSGMVDGVFISRTQQPESYEEMVGERMRLETLRQQELERRQFNPSFEVEAMAELHQLFEQQGVHSDDEEFRPGNYL